MGSVCIKLFKPLFLIPVALLLGGCLSGSGSKPINPGTGQIDIQVWRVLAPLDVPGNRGNQGCRLFDGEITQIVTGLQQNAPMFGGSTRFLWNGSVNNLVLDEFDAGYCTGPGRRICSPRLVHDAVFNLWLFSFPGWAENKINVYFCGDIKDPGLEKPAVDLWGLTYDPGVHSIYAFSPTFRCIIMNDGGFATQSGFDFLTSKNGHVLQHEATHYLARFDSQCFTGPSGTRCYDAGEHDNVSLNHILLPSLNEGPPLVPLPLKIPGGIATPGTELFQVFDRIITGNWNNP